MNEWTKLKNRNRVKNKTAVVTDWAGILGEQFCLALSTNGANVVVLDKNRTRTDEVVAKLRSENPNDLFIGMGCEVTKENEIEAALKIIKAKLGWIDIPVNNAATKVDLVFLE